jgi:hypothetical protein
VVRSVLDGFQEDWSCIDSGKDERWLTFLLGQCVRIREGCQKRVSFTYIVCCISTVVELWEDSKGDKTKKHEDCRIPDGFREVVIL